MTDLLVPIKAVPGASRDQIVGMLGDRVKIRVSAAPEGGRANTAIRAMIARALDVDPGAVEIIGGRSGAMKTVCVRSDRYTSVEQITRRLCP